MKGKTLIVARREFVSTVMRVGWLIGTFGMPVFVGLYAGVIMFVTSSAVKHDKPTGKAGVVDHAGIVHIEAGARVTAGGIPAEAKGAVEAATRMADGAGAAAGMIKGLLSGTEFVPFDDEEKALAALSRKEIGAVFVVPADYVATGKITAYEPDRSVFSEGKQSQLPLRRLLIKSLAYDRVEPQFVERILEPADVDTLTKDRDGKWIKRDMLQVVRRLGVPLGFTVLLMISILTGAGTMIQGVSEEKENRVIEVILSSVDARSLLLGKLLGLGAAGLLQLGIWLSMALVPVVLLAAGLALSPVTVLLCLAYFILAFLFYGTLITATGSIGTNAKDMQQYGMFWAIACALPMIFIEVILSEPNGTAARVLSYIPLTSPVVMMMRIGTGEAPAWEIALTLLLMAVTVVVTLRFAARLFRTALLMYGKRPSIPEIFRWMRQA
jgi:ABC-2 type transport system permease protein